MGDIEVEVRSFISKEQYERLLEFFSKKSGFLKEDDQETIYFDCKQDLRIQRNSQFSKIWMKKGNIHDGCREETEIRFDRDQFDNLKRLFLDLGMKVDVRWLRNRHEFDWDGLKVCLDYTRGYGFIIELETMASEEAKDDEHEKLLNRLRSLGIVPTSRHELDARFQQYRMKWKELVGE